MAEGEQTCCICLDIKESLFFMPCCGAESSSIKYCDGCIKLMCATEENIVGPVGGCPVCKKLFEMEFKVTGLKKFEVRGRCVMCCQGNKVLVSSDNLCENCLLGKAHPFKYICNRCGNSQVIPHPMWRYQNSPGEFGSASWACHQQCNDYTLWKIIAADIPKIPAALLPASWRPTYSDAESSLAAIRDRIHKN